MKTALFAGILVISVLISGCSKKPNPGHWSGDGISFVVGEEGKQIIKLNVFIPDGDQYLAQEYQDLKIINNKFESFQAGIPFMGIPKRDLKGEFLSNNSAKGSFNDIPWEAKPE